jgi:tetratricopeptide (TPR) repeat protein
VADGSLSALVASLSGDIASKLGAAQSKLYDFFYYLTGSPAMKGSPDFATALGAIRLHDREGSLSATQRLIEGFPKEPDAHVLRAFALLMVSWEGGTSSPRYAEFEEELAALDRVDPENPWDEIFRNLFLCRIGRSREAIQSFTRVLGRADLTPAARGNVLSLRAQSESQFADSAAAIRDLEESVRLDPTNDISYVMYAYALQRMRRLEEALIRSRQAVALQPASDQNQAQLGEILAGLERWKEAVGPFAKACELSRRQSFCAELAHALLKAGRAAAAARAAREAGSLPESDWGTEALAVYYAEAGNRSEAIRMLQRSLALGLDDPELAKTPAFASLRGDPAFRSILAEMDKRIAGKAP